MQAGMLLGARCGATAACMCLHFEALLLRCCPFWHVWHKRTASEVACATAGADAG